MKTIVRFCLEQRLLVFAFVALVVAWGVRSAFSLPIDAVPDITNNQVQVLTTAPTLGPVDVERTVTYPLESAMSGLPGLDEMRSVSRAGLSAITLVFEEDVDLLDARQLVGERLLRARGSLPEGAEAELGPMSTGLGEVLQFEVRARCQSPEGLAEERADCPDAMALRSLLDSMIAVELRNVPGVVEVNSFGGALKTYEVAVRPERLRAYGLSLQDLFEALTEGNVMAGGGVVDRAGEQMLVRGEGRVQSLEDIAEIEVGTRENADDPPVRVRDLAAVRFAPMIRQGAATRDGRGEVVTGIVMMRIGANGREVVQAASARLDAIAQALPEDVELDVFYDRSALVDRTIRTVATNLAEGALFVVGVLLLLLGSLRGGLIVAAAIPFAMLVAFIAMRALGLSGNLMSLGAIDFGIVVDGSIIVVESAVVALAARIQGGGHADSSAEGLGPAASTSGASDTAEVKSGEPSQGLSYAEASKVVLGSAVNVRKAALFGEAIIVLVYIPLLTLSGVEGRMFRPMALTVLFALGGAFVASLTFVPVLVATFMRQAGHHKEPFLVRLVHRVYPPLLRAAMGAPRRMAVVAILALASAVGIASQLGADFVPRLDEGAIAIQILRLPSVSLEESVRDASRVERVLRTFPEVDTVVSRTGRPEIATDPMGVELSDVFVMLKEREEWTTAGSREGLVEAISARLARRLPGLGFAYSQPIELRMSELISGSRADVAITLSGDELEELQRLSLAVQSALRTVDGATDVRGQQLTGMPTLEVHVDREKAARYGVSAADAMAAVQVVGGYAIGEVYEGQRRFALQVRLDAAARGSIDALEALPVRGAGGILIPLGQVATLTEVDSPAVVSRLAARRRTVVEVNVRGRDLVGFVAEAERAVAEVMESSDGVLVDFGGRFENVESATTRLLVAIPMALMLIFVLLHLAFGSAKLAWLVFLNVPVSALGGVLTLWARGMPLSISAAVGFIALFGISVLNGVVLLTTVQRLRREGMTAFQSAFEGAKRRVRAVVMTAAVATLGFVPMALSTGAGAEVQRPLASVVVGGLLSATFLTLFVLPSLYGWLFASPRSQGKGTKDA